MSQQQKWKCLDCGEEIENGRSDKRYCDDICRARANRKRLRLEKQTGNEDAHKAILRAIKRNYALLKAAMLGREEWIVDFEPLYRKGFDRMFYTSIEKSAHGYIRYYCFEIGWEDIEDMRLSVITDHNKLKVYRPGENESSNVPYPDREEQ